MAEYFRQELSMLQRHLIDLNSDLLRAKCKRERLLIESDIEVCISEIADCFNDFAVEVLTTEL